MFSIFANSLMTASRQKDWGAPMSGNEPDQRTRAERRRDSRDARRWLRQTGIR